MVDEEVWKGISNCDNYQVSSLGRVRNKKTGRVLKAAKKGGYCSLRLYSKKNFFVHQLVAQSFLENPENKPQVNHIDGNKANNMLCNLEWMTQSENIQHSFDIGLRPISEAVRESGRTLAEKFGSKNGFVFKKIVLDTGTGVFYEGAKEAADTINVNAKYLWRRLNGELKNTTKFKYV